MPALMTCFSVGTPCRSSESLHCLDDPPDAVRAVDALWRDPRFWELVREQSFLAGPGGELDGGDKVADGLAAVSPEAIEYVVGGRLWSTWTGFWNGTTIGVCKCVPCSDLER